MRSLKHRVLFVDDEATTLFAMRDYFSTRAFEMDCAADGDAARALLRQHSYSVLIADLRLSGSQSTEGLELADLVRKSSPSTRVVMLTAYDSPDISARARARGVEVLLRKPVPLPDLEKILLDLVTPRTTK